MSGSPLPPAAVALSFVDRINRGDLDGLAELMADDHALVVLDEPPLEGKRTNVGAWRTYMSNFPEYVIYPHSIASEGDQVAILGHTTGSHLALPDDEERKLTLIWVAEVRGEQLTAWRILEDTPEHRAELGLAT